MIVGSHMHAEWSDRFWQRVERGDAAACWPWRGSMLPKGYGRFYPAEGVGLYAHRVSWEIANGRPVPDGLHVMHACDNPRCVNPAHLSVGTRSDNMRDCVAKGRHGKSGVQGERHPSHKLTDAQVIEIRRRAAAGEQTRPMAREFGVTAPVVRGIRRGTMWKHLTGGM